MTKKVPAFMPWDSTTADREFAEMHNSDYNKLKGHRKLFGLNVLRTGPGALGTSNWIEIKMVLK